MSKFFKNQITRLFLARWFVRLFSKEVEVGIRDFIFDGNRLFFLNIFTESTKFTGMSQLAAIANHYNLPIRIHTWFRHEDGVRHSYFEPTDVVITPGMSQADLAIARDNIEQGRSKFLVFPIQASAQLATLHPI